MAHPARRARLDAAQGQVRADRALRAAGRGRAARPPPSAAASDHHGVKVRLRQARSYAIRLRAGRHAASGGMTGRASRVSDWSSGRDSRGLERGLRRALRRRAGAPRSRAAVREGTPPGGRRRRAGDAGTGDASAAEGPRHAAEDASRPRSRREPSPGRLLSPRPNAPEPSASESDVSGPSSARSRRAPTEPPADRAPRRPSAPRERRRRRRAGPSRDSAIAGTVRRRRRRARPRPRRRDRPRQRRRARASPSRAAARPRPLRAASCRAQPLPARIVPRPVRRIVEVGAGRDLGRPSPRSRCSRSCSASWSWIDRGCARRRLRRQREALLQEVGLLQAALLPVRSATTPVSVAYRPADGDAAGGDFYDAFALARRAHRRDPRRCVGARPRRARPDDVRPLHAAGLSRGRPRAARGLEGGVRRARRAPRRRLRDRHASPCTTARAAASPTRAPATRRRSSSGAAEPFEPVTACSAPPLGIGEPTGFRQSTFTLTAGARACLYTDGVTEARADGRLLGVARLERALERCRPTRTPTQLLDAVAADGRRGRRRHGRVPGDRRRGRARRRAADRGARGATSTRWGIRSSASCARAASRSATCPASCARPARRRAARARRRCACGRATSAPASTSCRATWCGSNERRPASVCAFG